MSQSTIVFGVLLLAFLIFITTRGELSKYIAVFFGGSGGTSIPAASPTAGTSSSIVGSLGSLGSLFGGSSGGSSGSSDFTSGITNSFLFSGE